MTAAVADQTRRLAGAWTAIPARREGWRVGDKVYVGRTLAVIGVVWGNGDCWAADPRDLSTDMVARIHQKRALEEERALLAIERRAYEEQLARLRELAEKQETIE